MKKTLLILLTIVAVGCSNTPDKRLTRMTSPVIVLAKYSSDKTGYSTLVTIDMDGWVYTFRGDNIAGAALIQSFEVGDTIK